MRYRNARAVLPEQLLKELQQYVRGEILYVPGTGSVRAAWGENNGTKERYINRNREIVMMYRNGLSKEDIAEIYHLSEYSIKKIIHGTQTAARVKRDIGQAL